MIDVKGIAWVVLLSLVGACTGQLDVAHREGTPAPGSAPDAQVPGRPPVDLESCGPAPLRILKLSPMQYSNTVRDALGVRDASFRPGDPLVATLPAHAEFTQIANAQEMTEPHVRQLLDVAGELAARVLADPELLPCSTATLDLSCLRSFVERLGTRLFRRPVEAEERDAFLAYVESNADAMGTRRAIELMVSGLFMSPHFLFRTEIGPEQRDPLATAVDMTAYERASALSYLITDAPPDPILWEAAETGELSTASQLEAQARRLATDVAMGKGIVRFLLENFGTDRVLPVAKDAEVYPAWRYDLATSLAAESRLFFEEVVWRDDARFATLLTADFSVLNALLGNYYNAPNRDALTDFQRATLPESRSGLLTHGSLLSVLAREDDTDPVARGRYIREVLLCTPPPAPPPTVNATPIPPDGERTQRERLAQHSDDPSCATCHALMDPLGLAFETYDGMGKYRKVDVGKPIDTSGTLTAAKPEGARFADARQLAELLAESPDALDCFVSRAFEFAHGRSPGSADACFLDELKHGFAKAGGNILDLVAAIASHETFVVRRVP